MGLDQPLPDSADVVVVGGGVMGTSIAFFLTRKSDLDVVLVEKDAIAAGSTGDSSAVLRHHYGSDETYTKMARWSHEFYRDFREETGERIAHEENALLMLGSDDEDHSEVLAGYETLTSLDVPASKLQPAEVRERYPMLAVDGFDYAVSDDEAGYSDGTDAANGFARAAQNRGATVLTNTAVTDLCTDDGTVTAVETDRGTVSCSDVVLAAGPWTPRLAERIGIDLPIVREREQVVILEPTAEYLETYPDLTPTTALPGGEMYIRPDFNDGVLVATHHSGGDVDPDAYDDRPDEETLLALTDALVDAVPDLETAGVRGQYCGVYSTTPDHDFIVDEAKGCTLACGFSGHGFKHAPAIGAIVSDVLLDGSTDLVDVETFALDRFDDDPEGHGRVEGQI
jgi:glycine/D-amino acid oxidase-like deaminating enzyme